MRRAFILFLLVLVNLVFLKIYTSIRAVKAAYPIAYINAAIDVGLTGNYQLGHLQNVFDVDSKKKGVCVFG